MSEETLEEYASRLAKTYHKQSLWLVCTLLLLIMLTMVVMQVYNALNCLAATAIFFVGCNAAYISAWKVAVGKAYTSQPMCWLIASIAKLLLTLVFLLAGFFLLRGDKPLVYSFIFIVSIFYMLMLVFDAIFFAKPRKKNTQ